MKNGRKVPILEPDEEVLSMRHELLHGANSRAKRPDPDSELESLSDYKAMLRDQRQAA